MLSRKAWLTIAILVASAVLLWVLRAVFSVFVLAFILAYVVAPLADRLEPFIKRTAASAVAALILFLVVAIVICLVLPLLYGELAVLAASLMKLAQDNLDTLRENPYFVDIYSELHQTFATASTQIFAVAKTIMNKAWTSGYTLAQAIFTIFVTPILTFFVLNEYNGIVATASNMVPVRYKHQCHTFAQEVNSILARYIRGQAQVCLGVGIYYCIALSVIGLKSGLTIGAIAGFICFVPYLGFFTGALLSILSKINYGGPSWGALAAVYVIGGIFENYVLSPKLLSKYIQTSPVLILFALMVGGSLAGFLGVMLAIPVAAVARTMVLHAYKEYHASDFYQKTH
jgi:predicted PurR-regulated permease PerM